MIVILNCSEPSERGDVDADITIFGRLRINTTIVVPGEMAWGVLPDVEIDAKGRKHWVYLFGGSKEMRDHIRPAVLSALAERGP